jgi:hypothetical protein
MIPSLVIAIRELERQSRSTLLLLIDQLIYLLAFLTYAYTMKPSFPFLLIFLFLEILLSYDLYLLTLKTRKYRAVYTDVCRGCPATPRIQALLEPTPSMIRSNRRIMQGIESLVRGSKLLEINIFSKAHLVLSYGLKALGLVGEHEGVNAAPKSKAILLKVS